jgi:hypothetical protein
VREQGGNWTVSFDRYYLTKSARRREWCVFRPAVPGTARLEFLSSNSQWWLDNVLVAPITAEYRDPRSVFPIFVNPSPKTIMVDPGPGRWLDLDSVAVTGSFLLAPWSSRILIAIDTAAVSGVERPPVEDAGALLLFPNPTRDGFEVLATDMPGVHAEIVVSTALGCEVYSCGAGVSNGRVVFHVPRLLTPGMHVVTIRSGNRIASGRVLLLR